MLAVMDDAGLCTLDELTELVEAALTVGYPGAPTARVRAVPDQRAIRWYATRGLVDRPVATRGRTALYGRRHLLQLVAIKRRQAQGRSLAEIQAELTGATDEALAAVAQLDPGAGGARPAAVRRQRFWADRPPTTTAAAAPAVPAPADSESVADGAALHGVRLAPGVLLLVENGAGSVADVAALRAAARPLLDLLTASRSEPANRPSSAPAPAPALKEET